MKPAGPLTLDDEDEAVAEEENKIINEVCIQCCRWLFSCVRRLFCCGRHGSEKLSDSRCMHDTTPVYAAITA